MIEGNSRRLEPLRSRIGNMSKHFWWLLAVLLNINICAVSENKGFCPYATPTKPSVSTSNSPLPQTPPLPDAAFAGTVSLQAVISDKGYVCSVQLIRGFDKTADKQAMEAVRRWHFEPARKDGHPVPVVVETQVSFWRKANGELVQSKPSESVK